MTLRTTHFTITPGGDRTMVVMEGEFDYLASKELTHELRQLLASSPNEVVFDMAGVRFIDSSGIAMLLRIYRRVVRDGGGTLRVINASVVARRTFDLCGLLEAFHFDGIRGATELRPGA